MVKKLFGLASVTVLTGLVGVITAAGCSSKLYVYGDEGGVEGGKILKPGDEGYDKAKDPIRAEAGKVPTDPPIEEPDPGATCPSTTPITAADIDAQLQWKPPSAF